MFFSGLNNFWSELRIKQLLKCPNLLSQGLGNTIILEGNWTVWFHKYTTKDFANKDPYTYIALTHLLGKNNSNIRNYHDELVPVDEYVFPDNCVECGDRCENFLNVQDAILCENCLFDATRSDGYEFDGRPDTCVARQTESGIIKYGFTKYKYPPISYVDKFLITDRYIIIFICAHSQRDLYNTCIHIPEKPQVISPLEFKYQMTKEHIIDIFLILNLNDQLVCDIKIKLCLIFGSL